MRAPPLLGQPSFLNQFSDVIIPETNYVINLRSEDIEQMNYKPMPTPTGWRLPQAPEQPTANAAKVISGLFIAEQATGTINPPKDVVATKTTTTTILQMPAWKPVEGKI